jgi:hypothetical protein
MLTSANKRTGLHGDARTVFDVFIAVGNKRTGLHGDARTVKNEPRTSLVGGARSNTHPENES